MVLSVLEAISRQQTVHHRLVVIGNRADGFRQGKNHVVVIHWQKISLSFLQPPLGCTGLALWTMTVAARVVRKLVASTAVAVQRVSPQCCGAALFDG